MQQQNAVTQYVKSHAVAVYIAVRYCFKTAAGGAVQHIAGAGAEIQLAAAPGYSVAAVVAKARRAHGGVWRAGGVVIAGKGLAKQAGGGGAYKRALRGRGPAGCKL